VAGDQDQELFLDGLKSGRRAAVRGFEQIIDAGLQGGGEFSQLPEG
jgi:hypothetical protein